MENDVKHLDSAIGENLRRQRLALGLTLEALAEASGVSRAMISRIERGETSPTALLLARLCAAFGTSLSAFFADAEQPASPFLARDEQPVWRDPDTGYIRRAVSPSGTGSNVDLTEVEFPAGARVTFAPQTANAGITQHMWLFQGEMELKVGETEYTLQPGDCLFMPLMAGITFHNPGKTPARYAIVLERRSGF
ncbi:XRE family transcriptional regulator [Phyllobacterium salinisoli]|uniref:XRE family transcriptional regulator n=1 Tax=Phyllobacterium salinisoli TaxID=1899321 RepID=A0A368K544_9HYPH|nr:helix-turn-helix domain-containing protein [Phyllobacterium salinisoli]RCS23765.1 XRE family transcriptional regulator [Phyllobacterium salinisoli]